MSTQFPLSSLSKTTLFDYPIHTAPRGEIVRGVFAWLNGSKPDKETLHVVTINPEIIMYGEQHPTFAQIIQQADLVLPDGAGVVWALKRNGTPVKRLPGIEFCQNLLDTCAFEGRPVALIGSTPEVMGSLLKALPQRHPNLKIAYSHHGYFQSAEECSAIAKAAASVQPQVVLVALGFPKQDQWIVEHRHLFKNAVLVGVGGSFDVWSGKVNRAPAWMRRLNLEWLYRFSKEPWRVQRAGKNLLAFVVKVVQTPSG